MIMPTGAATPTDKLRPQVHGRFGIYRKRWTLILEESPEHGLGLTQRRTGFVPWSRSVDLAFCPGTRTSRLDECDLIGALMSTVRVLSAVPASGVIPPTKSQGRQVSVWQKPIEFSPAL